MSIAKFRDYDPKTDEAYVNSSWKDSFYFDGKNEWLPRPVYYGRMNQLVPDLINRCIANGKLMVCHNPADRDHIWGWAAVEHTDHWPLVHYVFVRKEHRGKGYAKEMLRELLLRYTDVVRSTHWTKAAEALQDRYRMQYHPSLISAGSH